ncbi:hypothetical protein GCM10025876_06520 [Demequina litorisediminis]|uniref:Response regulatory domain-containing protein n=1 Tax=Demequina litorisediminis TaxID=1849022 RepID=A0ABQ6I9B5_9MICO|nr:hypothetical protein GCM10025876_06520 [Demequina litorisediminis]
MGQAGDGREAIAQARLTAPDVIVMDIRMPEMDGIEATARIVGDRQIEGSRILVLTTFETDEYVVEALRAGASGFLGKDAEPADLIRAIRTVAAGDEPALADRNSRADRPCGWPFDSRSPLDPRNGTPHGP